MQVLYDAWGANIKPSSSSPSYSYPNLITLPMRYNNYTPIPTATGPSSISSLSSATSSPPQSCCRLRNLALSAALILFSLLLVLHFHPLPPFNPAPNDPNAPNGAKPFLLL